MTRKIELSYRNGVVPFHAMDALFIHRMRLPVNLSEWRSARGVMYDGGWVTLQYFFYVFLAFVFKKHDRNVQSKPPQRTIGIRVSSVCKMIRVPVRVL